MNTHLVSGGGGFVGRNMVKNLLTTTSDYILAVDDLSVGLPPQKWPGIESILGSNEPTQIQGKLTMWGSDERFLFWEGDFREFLRELRLNPNWIEETYGLPISRFTNVYHFAAIVGGRAKIDGDPMMVALDLAIDAEFFYWAVRHQPEKVLYPSSSAAYPVNLQSEHENFALKESDINFEGSLGKPDMTYGWSKLTGEYLARIAAQYYDLSVTCIRPFSGYGEDQDLSYPIPAIAARAAAKEDPFRSMGNRKTGARFCSH